jgi:hypothetical protein
MNPIIKEGAFDADVRNQINLSLSQAIGVTSGSIYYLDPLNGFDGNSGLSPNLAVKTLSAGYALLTEGKNDVLVLIGNGLTSATARLSSAFTWSKNAAHLIGVCSGGYMSQRARIAPTSGVTAFANFFTISGSGCLFKNLEWFQGFGTGVAASICLTVSGGRNVFDGCHVAGMGDTASGHSTTSRNLKISTTGENLFRRCTIGIDTITRDVANASLEISGGAPRNIFEDCYFPMFAGASTALGIIVAAAAGSDRFQSFVRCLFINAIKSTGTQMDALATLAASMGGLILFKDCVLVGITGFGSDATSRAQMYVEGGTPSNTATALAVNPNA